MLKKHKNLLFLTRGKITLKLPANTHDSSSYLS